MRQIQVDTAVDQSCDRAVWRKLEGVVSLRMRRHAHNEMLEPVGGAVDFCSVVAAGVQHALESDR